MSQSLIDAAKASILAYNDKNWDAVSQALTSEFLARFLSIPPP